ncbi:MAG: type II secretion system F family protein [archaeon]
MPETPTANQGGNSRSSDGKILGLEKRYAVLLFSGMGALLVFLSLLFLAPVDMLGFSVGVAMTVAFVPYSFYAYLEKKAIKDMEENLPSFLRDIAESRKTGMTLPQALYKSAQVDYGKLSDELRKMANQISWGVPFHDVLQRFSARSKSPFIQRSIAIIIEAQQSGGALIETLDAVAKDARMLKDAEQERKAKLNQQSVIIYAIFFLFMAIVVALQKLMMPLLYSRGFALATEDPDIIAGYYKNLFFSMILIQGLFNGMIAGQISEGSPIMGLKHSALFVIVGIMVSWIFIF